MDSNNPFSRQPRWKQQSSGKHTSRPQWGLLQSTVPLTPTPRMQRLEYTPDPAAPATPIAGRSSTGNGNATTVHNTDAAAKNTTTRSTTTTNTAAARQQQQANSKKAGWRKFIIPGIVIAASVIAIAIVAVVIFVVRSRNAPKPPRVCFPKTGSTNPTYNPAPPLPNAGGVPQQPIICSVPTASVGEGGIRSKTDAMQGGQATQRGTGVNSTLEQQTVMGSTTLPLPTQRPLPANSDNAAEQQETEPIEQITKRINSRNAVPTPASSTRSLMEQYAKQNLLQQQLKGVVVQDPTAQHNVAESSQTLSDTTDPHVLEEPAPRLSTEELHSGRTGSGNQQQQQAGDGSSQASGAPNKVHPLRQQTLSDIRASASYLNALAGKLGHGNANDPHNEPVGEMEDDEIGTVEDDESTLLTENGAEEEIIVDEEQDIVDSGDTASMH